jgi:predicted DNA binding CopG/RHH family protein
MQPVIKLSLSQHIGFNENRIVRPIPIYGKPKMQLDQEDVPNLIPKSIERTVVKEETKQNEYTIGSPSADEDFKKTRWNRNDDRNLFEAIRQVAAANCIQFEQFLNMILGNYTSKYWFEIIK